MSVGAGVLRGMGRQTWWCAVNIVAYYCLGLPFSCLLLYRGYSLGGVWCGMTLGLVVGSLSTTTVLLRFTDWRLEAERASARISFDACTADAYTTQDVHNVLDGLPSDQQSDEIRQWLSSSIVVSQNSCGVPSYGSVLA